MQQLTNLLLEFKSISLLKRASFLLNAAVAMEILDLISLIHLASFVTTLKTI